MNSSSVFMVLTVQSEPWGILCAGSDVELGADKAEPPFLETLGTREFFKTLLILFSGCEIFACT